jgi:hypothetical protein
MANCHATTKPENFMKPKIKKLNKNIGVISKAKVMI